MIFKQETIQSWFSGVSTSINNEVVQPFQNAEQVIWKYNQAIQHNSLTQKGWERLLAQSDDSLKAYLTSIKGTSASITGYNVSLQGNITGLRKVSSAISQYNTLSTVSTEEQITFANAVSVTNGRLGTYLTGLNGAKASLGGYVVSLVCATVKTVALKLATIALNSAVTMGASLIVSGIVSAISEWINKTENMISASEDAVEKIKSINNELKNNQKTISDTAKRYAELAQGVNQLTGENISLNSEDYKEFLDLSNQLAEMFPTLTRNYNDNGDAIIQLSGDVDTIVGSLQNLIEAQRDLANRQIVDELPTVFDGVAAKSDRYESELEDLEDKKNALLQGLEDFTSEGLSQKIQTGLNDKYFEIASNDVEEYSRLIEDYTKLLENANLEYSLNNFEPIWNGEYDNDGKQVLTYKTSIYIDSSNEDVEKAKTIIDTQIEGLAKQYEDSIETLNEEINATNEKNKANWSSLSNSIFAWLSTDDSFMVMDDTMQATVQNIVNSLDWGSLDFSSWEDAKQYIQDNILSLFHTTEGKDILDDIQVMFGIQTQFNNGDIPVEQYQSKLQDFLASIETLPPESKKSIMLLFGIQTNEDGTTTSSLDAMITNVEKKLQGTDFDDKVGELSLDDLKIASELEVPMDSIQSWDELLERIENVKSETFKIPDLFSQLTNSKDSIDTFTSSVKSAYEAYETLLNPNVSSSDMLSSIQTISEAVSAMDGSLNWELIGGYNDSVYQLGNAIEYISQKYAESILSDAGIDVNSEFGQMLANNIVQSQKASTQLENLNGHIDSLQSAYKDLTDIVETYNHTGHITFDQLQTLLELEPQYLACLIDENGQLSINQQSMLALAHQRLDDAEAQAIQQAIAELGAITLQDEEVAVKNTSNAFSNSIKNISAYNDELAITIAEASVGASSIRDLYSAITGAEAQGVSDEQINTVLNNLEAKLQLIKDTRNNLSGNFGDIVGIDSSSTKETETNWKDLLDKETTLLEKQLEAGVITFEEYANKRKSIIEDYYRQGLISAEDYYSALEDMYDHQISLYDRVIDAVTDKIDGKISDLEDDKKSIEETYNLRISAIQTEIDALEKARKEREQQVELEKALYEVEKARSQRDVKLYSGTDRGVIYTNDTENLRDAEENLEDEKYETHISKLESQIESLEKEMDNATDAIDDQIDALEEYKDKWVDVGNEYERINNDMIAQQVLGANFEEDILNQRMATLEIFKNNYISAQQAMADAAWKVYEAQVAAGSAPSGGSGSSGSERKTSSDNTVGEVGDSYKWHFQNKSFMTEQEAKKAQTDYINKEVKQAMSAGMSGGLEQSILRNKLLSRYPVQYYHTGLDEGYVGDNKTCLLYTSPSPRD